jgi:hypothetical protein
MADVHKFSERVIDLAERTSPLLTRPRGREFGNEGCGRAGSCFLGPALASMHS